MNDTDMSVQLRKGFRESAEGSLYRGSSLGFHSTVLNNFEVSDVLMGHVLNVIHQRYNFSSEYLVWWSLEIVSNETVSFLKTFLWKTGIKLSFKIEDLLYIICNSV
jgi:hypothetical protein